MRTPKGSLEISTVSSDVLTMYWRPASWWVIDTSSQSFLRIAGDSGTGSPASTTATFTRSGASTRM
jgi:hypothetical protein